MRDTERSVIKPTTPYAVTRIIDPSNDNDLNEFLVDRKEYEIVTDLVFQAQPDSDIQRHGNRLADAVWKILQPTDPTNPRGFDLPIPRWWDFVSDTNFKAKLRRTVTKLSEQPKEISGSYYTIPLQYKVEVYPNQPKS
jgi:hypothetical protein